MVLLKECLNSSFFIWSGNYFAQIRRLAMGQRLAPTLAIAFMSKVEAPNSISGRYSTKQMWQRRDSDAHSAFVSNLVHISCHLFVNMGNHYNPLK
ncbi:hypothetical protein KIN20_028591 [Parelaphostrongylus tenuis]|uniref:Uncharacterized protein n=1 Tax=Parelaphostrongylus tenuis TaxID=148309 RepID=A0AAD5WET9_PARTN|nr:hypothetical protein KIN20_028591 [Parelaphostrongylus tenuis]